MQKKVLVFVPEFPVTTETFISRELSALAELGRFDIQLVAMKRGTAPIPENLKSKVYFHRVSFFDYLRGKWSSFWHPVRRFRAFKAVGFTRPFLFIKILGYANVFSKFQPDLIYAHFLSTPSTIALGVSILLDVPLVISAHARDVLEYPDLITEKAKHAKFITFCNKNALGAVKSKVDPSLHSKLKLIYHGVDPESLVLPSGAGSKKFEYPFIFTIGRLEEKKGIKYLIEASETLKKEVSHVVYIAGGGPLLGELESLIKSKGLEESFVLLGKTPFNEVLPYLHAADMYVQPSINAEGGDADGVPNSLIEAAMLKVPIVTTDAGSISDFLDSSNALIVPQKDSVKLAEAIKKLLNDADLRNSLSTAAYNKAIKMFDLDKSIKEIENLFV